MCQGRIFLFQQWRSIEGREWWSVPLSVSPSPGDVNNTLQIRETPLILTTKRGLRVRSFRSVGKNRVPPARTLA